MPWNVYLAGEIHSDWREQIASGAEKAGLDVAFSGPVTDHGASDDVGVAILGDEGDSFWKDHKGAGVNAIRTQTLIRQADVVVVRFGEDPASGLDIGALTTDAQFGKHEDIMAPLFAGVVD